MSNEEKKSNFTSNVESLFRGMETFLTTKTVVGDPIHMDDTIILPLLDVAFGAGAGAYDKSEGNSGGGGMGGKMTPSAVLIIKGNTTKLINVKDASGFDKIINMIPDVIENGGIKDKFSFLNRKKKSSDVKPEQDSASSTEEVEEEN